METNEDRLRPHLAAIAFPSDRLTLGRLRALHPEALDPKGEEEGLFGDSEAGAAVSYLVHCERRFLEIRLDEILSGVPRQSQTEWDRMKRQMADAISEGYQRYGMAAGPAQASELLREIDAGAALIAQRLGGRGP